jgi:hypothetical protein
MNKLIDALLWVFGWGIIFWFFWFLLDFDLLMR